MRHVLHCLNDFFTAGSPCSTKCLDNPQAMLSLFKCTNAPLRLQKLKAHQHGLRIVIDTSNMTADISQEHK